MSEYDERRRDVHPDEWVIANLVTAPRLYRMRVVANPEVQESFCAQGAMAVTRQPGLASIEGEIRPTADSLEDLPRPNPVFRNQDGRRR